MTELNTDQLKKSFHQEMIHLYKKIIKLVKYKPTRLMDFINKYGGYEAAVKYISTESNVQDFAVLWENERLDLSVEALITSETYRSLFQEEIVAFCDRKLKEYSYAPNKIEEVEEPTGYFDEEEKIDLAELLKQKELYLPKIVKKDYPMYYQAVAITCNQWKEMVTNTKVVTANNLDLLLRIYAIGDQVGPKDLAKENGYSSTYPYKEVIMALGKRIKTYLKVDIPTGEEGKPLWWHLLFNGGLKDNSDFEWSLKNDLRKALDELIAEGTIQKIEVQSQKERKTIEETVVEVAPAPKASSSSSTSKKEELSAFDRLFESIMAGSTSTSKKETREEEAKEEKLQKENISKEEPLQVFRENTPITTEKISEKPLENESTSPIDLSQKAAEQVDEQAVSASDVSETDYKEKLKKECLEYYGAICDLCGFDFGYTYGEAYESCIDVHNHKQVDGEEILETTHPIEDLIPVCHNCHHVIHSTNPPISVEDMRKMVKA